MVVKVASSVAEPDVTSKRMRVKVLVKKPANGTFPEIPKVNCLKKPRIADDRSEVGTGGENNMLGTDFHVLGVCPLSKQVPKVDCGFEKSSGTFNRTTPVIDNKKVNSTVGLKRRSEEVFKGPVSKKLKMDRSATLLCQAVLEKLMHNQLSGPFQVPVDPVVWKIDDYFDIIKKPMDLGTIKQKLVQHRYVRAEEFEADVRLTFSNAMLYNPPDHWIHQRASCLVRVFDRLWKPVKIKLDREHRDIRQRGSESSLDKTACNVKGEYRAALHLTELSFQERHCHEQRSAGDLKKSSIQVQWGSESSLDRTACNVKGEYLGSTPSHRAQFSRKTLPQTEEGPGGLKQSAIQVPCSDLKPVLDCKPNDAFSSKSLTNCKPRDSSTSKSQSDLSGPVSRLHMSACPMSSKFKCDITTGNMIAHDDFTAVKDKHTSTLQMGSFGQDSAGTLSFMDVERGCASVPSTSGSFGATANGLDTKSDVELSPSRALRVAKLKSRYAETIMKAQHHTLLEPGAEADKTNRQQEKEIMQRRQHEETSNMEAKIRAAKSAARSREESKLKRQRQEAREAARMAIRKMERSVNVDNNLQVMRDLEALVGTSLVVMCPDRTSRTMWNYEGTNNLRSPLEQLGLYIKEEYSVSYDSDDAFLDEEREEGELVL